MKRAFLIFVMAVMLTASLAACGSTSSNDSGNGTGNGTVADNNTAGSRARGGGSNTGSGTGGSARGSGTGGSTMSNSGRYYADDNGDVFGGNDGIGGDIGRAAGDMMDGMGNAMQDMTR